MIKVLERVGLREIGLNRPTVDIIPNEEKLKATLTEIKSEMGLSTTPSPFPYCA